MAMELTFFGDAPNYKLVEIVRKPLEAYFAEVTKILPELPRKLSIWLDNKWLSKETGTGGYAGIDPKAEYHSMLDVAIYESCATVFERNYANVSLLWGEYKQHS